MYTFKKSPIHYAKGFTLFEIIIVIAIIGILASIILVNLNLAKQRSNDALRISQLNQIGKALEMYYSENGKYPSNANGTFMYADSRNPTNTSVPAYSNLMGYLVTAYLPAAPTPPFNGGQEGSMCSGCDGYRYQANSYGAGYMICGYLAQDHGGSGYQGGNGPFYGSNASGPYFCWANNCGAGSTMGTCNN